MIDQVTGYRPNTEDILENITQCVITTDMNGIVTYWNATAEHIFGYLRQEMLQRSLIKIYPSVAEQQFQQHLRQLRNGQEVQGQWRTLTKDGTIIWVDVHASPLIDDEGNPTAIIASAYNIQDLKNIEKELEENKVQAQAILETTVDGVVIIDKQGIIKSFNQAATCIFGYGEEEARGQTVKVLIPESMYYEYDDYLKQFRKGTIGGYRRELMGKRKDGTLFPMEVAVSMVYWKGEPIFAGVVNDISERRRLEREILRISEEERQSLGQDLHDGLGQMLTGIGLLSQNLANKLKSEHAEWSKEVQEISDLIKDADKYTKALAHGLVHVDIEAEGLQPALHRLSEQAKTFFKVNCSFRNKLDKKVDSQLKALNLYRIAQEAISNAVKHGKAENIAITLTSENGSLSLIIEDDGIGFSESESQKTEKGMGIHIMNYRSNIMSGHLDITNGEDQKTTVKCTIPHER